MSRAGETTELRPELSRRRERYMDSMGYRKYWYEFWKPPRDLRAQFMAEYHARIAESVATDGGMFK